MRARGYALSELLVAVAIAGLIIGTLTFLNVDYINLGRRVGEARGPYELGARAQAGDPCAVPGAVLTAGDGAVVAQGPQEARPLLTVTPQDGVTWVQPAAGPPVAERRPVRVVVEATPTPGGSLASVEVGDATVGVLTTRCDLPQVCSYDPANAMCAEDESMANAAHG